MIGAPAELEYEEVQEMIFNYTKAIEMNTETPDNLAILYARRSTLLAALEDFEASLNDAKSSIDFDPKTSIGYYRKGFALCGLKQFGLAAEAFQQGLAIDIHNNQLHHALMITLKYARTENSPTKGSHITRTGTNFHRRQET
jgi:tetratricopeptide (TPR) repeat protein